MSTHSNSGADPGICVRALLTSNIGPMLEQYCAQYWDNIGHNIAPILAARSTTTIFANIVDQYWANVGHKYWTDIGKTRGTILAQYWAQYCSNIGIATQRQYWPILGKNCHDIGSYTLRLSANIAEQYRAGLDHIGNNTRPNISYTLSNLFTFSEP